MAIAFQLDLDNSFLDNSFLDDSFLDDSFLDEDPGFGMDADFLLEEFPDEVEEDDDFYILLQELLFNFRVLRLIV